MSSSGGDKAIGWAHNASYWWGNISQNHADGNGLFMPLPSDDDSHTAPIPSLDEIRIRKLQILSISNPYQVDWFPTYGFPDGSPFSSITGKITNIFGEIHTDFPNAQEDCAFHAFNTPIFHSLIYNNVQITTDTLLCGEDSIYCGGIYKDDLLGIKYNYYWNFGNGQTSTLYHPTAIFQPGTYLTTLIATDSAGITDTLQQYTYLPNCNYDSISRTMALNKFNVNSKNSFILIVPNPNNGNFNLEIIGIENKYLLEIFDTHGKIVFSINSEQNICKLNLVNLENGLYLVKLTQKNFSITEKFIKQ